MAWSRCLATLVLMSGMFVATAQENRYMVFFKDKTSSPYSTAQPLDFLSQRAVDRRVRQGIAVTEVDIPVNENYIQGVRDAGANVFFPTRWMNGVLVQCDATLIVSLGDLPFVDRIEFVALIKNSFQVAEQKVS